MTSKTRQGHGAAALRPPAVIGPKFFAEALADHEDAAWTSHGLALSLNVDQSATAKNKSFMAFRALGALHLYGG